VIECSGLRPPARQEAAGPFHARNRTGSGAKVVFAVVFALLLAPPPAAALSPRSSPALLDEGRIRGIHFAHVMEVFPPGVEAVLDGLPPIGAAAAAGDVNGDGRDDLFLVSSARGAECALYLAGPDGQFRDVTPAAGLLGLNDDLGLATGASFADVDLDGDLDLHVVRWGPDLLLLNHGDGTFERTSGAAADPGNGAAAVFFDADKDGDPDLYIANLLPDVPILQVDRLDGPAFGVDGAWNGGTNRLYRNDGGRFVEVTSHSGTGDTGWSITAAAGDVDGDGDPDLLVGNVYGPLRLYRNDGSFRFTPDRDCFRGLSMSLGIDFGDVNRDLRDDILVTGLGHPRGAVERSCLWLSRDGEEPEEAGDAAGLGDVFRGAGARFVDLDRDGDLDLLFANGFDRRGGTLESHAARWVRLDSLGSANPLARFRYPGAKGGGRWCVAWNDGGTFTLDREGGVLAGPGCAASILDVDADGRLDAYVACQGAVGALLVHAVENRNRWIAFEPCLRNGRSAAWGARVTVRPRDEGGDGGGTGGRLLARGLDASGGSRGEAGRHLHFGLGERETVDAQIVWPSGAVELLTCLASGQTLRLVEPEAGADGVGSGSRSGSGPARGAGFAGHVRWAPDDSLEHRIFAFERALRRQPLNFELAADYRDFCLEHQLYARALRFVRELRGPLRTSLALHRLLTHVDGVRRIEEGLLVQGGSAAMALIEAGELIRVHPEFWTAHRLRALNYLYWPVEFDQLPRCVADYRRCSEIQSEIQARSPGSRALPRHRAQVFLELGDAYAKGGQVEEALSAWRRGQEMDPGESGFAERLAWPKNEVTAIVAQRRSLDRPPSTRIPWIETEMSREPLSAERALAQAGARFWNATGSQCRNRRRPVGVDHPGRQAMASQLLAQAAEEPNNLVTHMLAYGRALAQVEDLVAEAQGARPGPSAGTQAVLLARAWLLLKGALTVEQVTAAHQALGVAASRLASAEGNHPRRERYELLARLGMGDAEILLGRLESGYKTWRVHKDFLDDPVVARRALLPVEHVEQEVWSWSFGQGALEIDTLADLLGSVNRP